MSDDVFPGQVSNNTTKKALQIEHSKHLNSLSKSILTKLQKAISLLTTSPSMLPGCHNVMVTE